MNLIRILYYSLKMTLQNIILKIKEIFKSKPKKISTVCFTTECSVAGYHIINLLKEIKLVNFKDKVVESYPTLLEIFEKYPELKSVYHSVLIQNILSYLIEKYPNNFVYIEEFDKNPLVIKVHLFNKDVFEKIFVIPEHRQKLENDAIISITYAGKEQNTYIFGIKVLNETDMSIMPADVIRTLSNFKSILDIVNADINDSTKEINFYLLNESFNKLLKQRINNYQNNDDIIKTILGDKDLDEFIIYNKIL